MHIECCNGDNPFTKVKCLVREMISSLEDRASSKSFPRAVRRKEGELAELEKLSASFDLEKLKNHDQSVPSFT